MIVLSQVSRDPLPGDEVASIWEDTKEMGVLIGKGGLFGNVNITLAKICFQN